MSKIKPPTQTVAIRKGKQYEIMQLIVKCNPDGSFCDVDQIMSRLSYSPKKPSFAFSLRCLENKGLIERVQKLRLRDGSKRRVWKPTMLGYKLTKAFAEANP